MPGPRLTQMTPGRPASRASAIAMTRARLVPAGDSVDVGAAIKRVEQAEIALAGNAEQPVDAVGDEALDNQLTNGSHRLLPAQINGALIA